jgi:hypothetical protein
MAHDKRTFGPCGPTYRRATTPAAFTGAEVANGAHTVPSSDSSRVSVIVGVVPATAVTLTTHVTPLSPRAPDAKDAELPDATRAEAATT